MKQFRLILISIFLFHFSYFLNAQSVGWEKSYGWDMSDIIFSIIKIGDNYYSSGGSGYATLDTAPLFLVKGDFYKLNTC